MKMDEKRLMHDYKEIIRLISSGASFREVLKYILLCIEHHHDISAQVFATAMLYDSVHHRLVDIIAPSLPEEFKNLIVPMEVGPYEGSCGTAGFTKRPIIVSNIENNPLCEKFRLLARKFGFKACWSTPILFSKIELLGTFAVYYKEVFEPNLFELQNFNSFNELASIAIQLTKRNGQSSEQLKGWKKVQDSNQSLDKDEKLVEQLKGALERNEFSVYYQPYFDLKQNNIGVEALIRWDHPNSGILSPSVFLPIMEKTGFILLLEKWVMEQAINDIKSLENVTLSVNISSQQLENPCFPNIVSELLERFSFKPKNFSLEITERFLIRPENIYMLHRLKELGVSISIDDFGTSYSSLQYLKDLPIDELKIDRSFIANMESNFNKQKIVEMIIMLGHQLDLKIVAEGVETTSQLQLLKEMNCDRVQGFLFSKPQPLEKLKQKNFEKMRNIFIDNMGERE